MDQAVVVVATDVDLRYVRRAIGIGHHVDAVVAVRGWGDCPDGGHADVVGLWRCAPLVDARHSCDARHGQVLEALDKLSAALDSDQLTVRPNRLPAQPLAALDEACGCELAPAIVDIQPRLRLAGAARPKRAATTGANHG